MELVRVDPRRPLEAQRPKGWIIQWLPLSRIAVFAPEPLVGWRKYPPF